MKIKFALIFCLLGVMNSSAIAQTDKIIYRSVFDMKYAFCSIKANGVIGQDNRDEAGNGRGLITGSTSAILFMENGENEIAIEMASVNWFDSDIKDEKLKDSFRQDAYCNLDLIKYSKDGSQTISNINVTIDANGKPSAKKSIVPEGYYSINREIIEQSLTGFEVKTGFTQMDTYAPLWYPKGMILHEFSRKIVLDGLPEWPWINATSYIDTPEQRQLLQSAYEDLWHAFNKRDINKISKLMALSFKAFSYVTDSTEDEVFKDRAFYNRVKNGDFKMIPIDWDAYEVKVMNKGRMVRLINKTDPDFSPISYVHGENGYTSIPPIFSLIDGKFFIVL